MEWDDDNLSAARTCYQEALTLLERIGAPAAAELREEMRALERESEADISVTSADIQRVVRQIVEPFHQGMIIGTLNRWHHCKASQDWLGRYRQDGRISQGKLWNIEKLNYIPLDTQWSLLLQDRVKKRLLEERQMELPSGGSGSW